MSMYHCGKDKSEKRIWVKDFGFVNINTHLCKILCLDDNWHMETFELDGMSKIRFVSGYDYSVYLGSSTIEALLGLSKKYPGAIFCMEDTIDGYLARWQNGEELCK